MAESELKVVPGCDLFFHAMLYGGDEKNLLANLLAKQPLFGLDGRATVTRSEPYISGQVFIFRVPETLQTQQLETPRCTKFEQYYDDDQRRLALKSVVETEHEDLARDWLSEVITAKSVDAGALLEDVRALPGENLLAAGLLSVTTEPNSVLVRDLQYCASGVDKYDLQAMIAEQWAKAYQVIPWIRIHT